MQHGLMENLRKSLLLKMLFAFIALSFLVELWFPTLAMALTSGPSQPEIQSFEPVGTTDMVDLFTGDFVYNIPLFELPGPNGGYPFNIAYHSGVGMDQEASWVGLGWNLNPGAIDRTMRGIPDDFNGDEIKKTLDIKANHTFGLGVGADLEVFGGSATKSLNVELKVYYNNYKGVGYSLNPSFGMQMGGGTGLGAGLTLDSQEGVGLNASVSLSGKPAEYTNKYSLGIGFHSKRGLDLSLSASRSKKTGTTNRGGNDKNKKDYYKGGGGGSSYSFSESSYTPVSGMAMQNDFLAVAFKTGIGTGGAFTDMSFSGFYNIQYLKKSGKTIPYKSFGYNYLGSTDRTNTSLLDFNRSKDGMIRKTSPNLPIPALTYDYYNILGQGIGGMFRPYRNDIGSVYDPEVNSNTAGGSIGVDIGPGASPHVGLEGSFSSGSSYSGPWTDDNSCYGHFDFKDNITGVGTDYEPVYFKAHGEYTSFATNEMDYIGGIEPVKPTFSEVGGFLNRIYSPQSGSIGNKRPDVGRMPRNMVPQPITNSQLGGNSEVLGEYKIRYFPEAATDFLPTSMTGSVPRVNRGTSSEPKSVANHYGGFTVLNPEGARYVYGLPVYNNVNEERLFAVPPPAQGADFCGPTVDFTTASGNVDLDHTAANSDNFYSKTELPPYAYSYLLTSVLGNDYVDIGTPGPSNDDYGYWVKFSYIKKEDDYKWRAPYKDANFIKGLATTGADDKASFVYGEKEVFYLATAETKTHIAVFEISPRNDGFGVGDRFNKANVSTSGNNSKSYQLDKIKLFTKNEYSQANPVPIKTVEFLYDYSLCGGIYNNKTGGGKLTLKQMKITYQKSTRGSLSPYIFTYGGNSDNPNYSEFAYDRWGNYKPPGTNSCNNLENPYVDQFNKNNAQSKTEKTSFKTQTDNNASAWHLKNIRVPTGGNIAINYESDDYAYVQHRTALQMFKISPGCGVSSGNLGLYASGFSNSDVERRVYFDLEYPIPITDPNIPQKIKNSYIEPLKRDNGEYQLYYNIKVNLRDNLYESVAGYADLDVSNNTFYGADCTNQIDIGNGTEPCYTRGFVTLKKTIGKNGPITNHHPFSIAAWQHIRVNQPDLLTASIGSAAPGSSKADKAAKVRSLASIFPAMKQLFSNYMNHAESKGWGKYLKPEQSFIRLGTPDKIKYGGGTRVKQITFNDNWYTSTSTIENYSSYGQVYEYTTTEDGMAISSGVAQYEPLIGGDENALRYAKTYPQGIRMKTDNNLFFEYPVNEAYFPGPLVGYSKVTVKSKATNDAMASVTLGYELTTTSGVTMHEFYTAREFPVITDETEIEKQPFDLFIPIPLIGMTKKNNLTASQGYSIELNDMHGKQKSVSNYALDADGRLVQTPVSSVRYDYKFSYKNYDGATVKVLNNTVDVIESDIPLTGTTSAPTSQKIMGVEYEFFTDMRKSRTVSASGGLNGNVDQIGPFPIPVPWPTISKFTNDLRTIVTNKIIHRAGILEKTIATDGLSTMATKNILFDNVTGRPLLTSVTNNYDNDIYNYEIPAHWKYDGMGAAYKNIGLKIKNTVSYVSDPSEGYTMNDATGSKLIPGDEFIVGTNGRATYLGIKGNAYLFHSTINPNGKELLLVRSGARNMLNTSIGNISALEKTTTDIYPTQGISQTNLPTTKDIPDDFIDFLNYLICNSITKNFVIGTTISLNDYPYSYLFPESASLYNQSITIQACPSERYHPTCHSNFGSCNSLSGTITETQWNADNTDADNTNNHRSCRFHFISGSDVCHSIGLQCTGIDHIERAGSNSIKIFYLDGTEETEAFCIDVVPIKRNISNVLQSSATEFKDYWPQNLLACITSLSGNPYATGEKGIWRPHKNYYYQDNRYQDAPLNLSADGVFDGSGTDKKFYLFNWINSIANPIPKEWISNQTITRFNQNGFETENKDILGIFSSAIYGYDQTLPVAVGNNMRDNEFLFEGFDDPTSPHISGISINNLISHSGKKSMNCVGSVTLIPSGLKLVPEKSYVFSGWVSVYANSTAGLTNSFPDFSQAALARVDFYNSSNNLISSYPGNNRPRGEVVDGWQKIEYEFTVPIGTNSIRIFFEKANPVVAALFDDIRIFPAKGNMQSYVYNPSDLRLMATLDENNYATFYSYDEEGNLFLLQKETPKGIMTLKEVRSHKMEN